jgi:hypothetical protein
MYTVDDFIRKLEEIRQEHGGETPVVVPTSDHRMAYENASVGVRKMSAFEDAEGGCVFRITDDSQLAVVVIV